MQAADKTFPGGEDAAEEVACVWRSILGLPKDFPISSFQVTVCMALSDMIIQRYRPDVPDGEQRGPQ
jgi:hypothetical protein